MRIRGWDYDGIYSNLELCGVISCGERLSKDFFHKLKACLFSCSHNNNTMMIIRLGSTLARQGIWYFSDD